MHSLRWVGYASVLVFVVWLVLPGKGLAAPALQTGGTLDYGETVSGELTPNSLQNEWTFEGSGGDLVTITLTADDGSFDTYLRLNDEDGIPVASADDGAGGTDSLIDRFRLPVDGRYTIVAGGLAGAYGPYHLTLEQVPRSAAGGAISVGETVSGVLTPAVPLHYWTFEARAGEWVLIDLQAPDQSFDTEVVLLDSGDNELARNDDYGPGTNSRITRQLIPENGTYTIVAGGYQGALGEYVLSLSVTDAQALEALPISPGQSITHRVSASQPELYWVFDAQEGQGVTITMTAASANFDPYVALLDAGGNELASNDDANDSTLNARIEGFYIPADGQYTIVTRDLNYAGGQFHLQLVEAEASPVSINNSDPVTVAAGRFSPQLVSLGVGCACVAGLLAMIGLPLAYVVAKRRRARR